MGKRRCQENAYVDEEVQSWEGDCDDACDREEADYDDYDDYDGVADSGKDTCDYEEGDRDDYDGLL